MQTYVQITHSAKLKRNCLHKIRSDRKKKKKKYCLQTNSKTRRRNSDIKQKCSSRLHNSDAFDGNDGNLLEDIILHRIVHNIVFVVIVAILISGKYGPLFGVSHVFRKQIISNICQRALSRQSQYITIQWRWNVSENPSIHWLVFFACIFIQSAPFPKGGSTMTTTTKMR